MNFGGILFQDEATKPLGLLGNQQRWETTSHEFSIFLLVDIKDVWCMMIMMGIIDQQWGNKATFLEPWGITPQRLLDFWTILHLPPSQIWGVPGGQLAPQMASPWTSGWVISKVNNWLKHTLNGYLSSIPCKGHHFPIVNCSSYWGYVVKSTLNHPQWRLMMGFFPVYLYLGCWMGWITIGFATWIISFR
jgi:hypothetical protein